MKAIKVGLAAEISRQVKESESAQAWGSGALAVFSTPALVGLMESAAMSALEGCLAEGQTTVGSRISVRHLAATPIGMTVRARAELVTVDGRKMVFSIQAWDEVELIGEAEHDRHVVDGSRFMNRVNAKSGGPGS